MAMKKFLIALIVIFSLFAMSACKISVKYNVDFYVDGALYATVGTDGDVLTMPNDPEKEGYSFEGWFWDETSREKPFTLASLLDQPLSEENRYSVYAQFSEIDYSQFLSVEGFALQDGTFRAQVPNATDRLDLEGKISLGEGVPYFLSADEAGNDRMDSLVLSLKEGDNRFYLQVQNATKTVSVALDVRRAPLYTVTFHSLGHDIYRRLGGRCLHGSAGCRRRYACPADGAGGQRTNSAISSSRADRVYLRGLVSRFGTGGQCRMVAL